MRKILLFHKLSSCYSRTYCRKFCMKNALIRNILSGIICTCFFFSCQNDHLDNSHGYLAEKADSILCIDGMLKFRDSKVFINFINQINFSSDGEFISKKYGYDSMESMYCNLQEEFNNLNDSASLIEFARLNSKYIVLDDSLFIQPKIQSYIYRVICNKEGFYSIANTIYEVTDKNIKIHNNVKSSKHKTLRYSFDPQLVTKGGTQTNLFATREYKNNKNNKIIGLKVQTFFYYTEINENTNKYTGTYKIQFHSYGKFKNVFGKYKSYKTILHFDGLVYKFRVNDASSYPIYLMGGHENYNFQTDKEAKNFYLNFNHSNTITYSGEISQPTTEVLRVRARSRATGDCGATVNSFPINDYPILSTCK